MKSFLKLNYKFDEIFLLEYMKKYNKDRATIIEDIISVIRDDLNFTFDELDIK